MRIAELLESRVSSFKHRNKIWVSGGPLAIYLYATDHPDARPTICLFAKTHGGWVGTHQDENPVAECDGERSEIDRILNCFAEKFCLDIVEE